MTRTKLGVRILYRYWTAARSPAGDPPDPDRMLYWHGRVYEKTTRNNSVEVRYTGGDLREYVTRFNDRDHTLFEHDTAYSGEWPTHLLAHSSLCSEQIAWNALFLFAGRPLDGVPDALRLGPKLTVREMQVRRALIELEAA